MGNAPDTPPSPWRPVSNGSSAMHWFLLRYLRVGIEMLEDKRGQHRRFGSFAAAKKAADRLNAA